MPSPRARLIGIAIAIAALSACDARQIPTLGGIRTPPVDVSPLTGSYELKQVDGVDLPHRTTQGGTVYDLVAGSFELHADSTWLFSTTEVLSGTNGQTIGTSPANYTGTWSVTDSTINIKTNLGFIRSKADTLFWKGGPKHSWEDSLTFTLVRR